MRGSPVGVLWLAIVLMLAASGVSGVQAAAAPASSPSATMKAAYEAGKKKDTAALKKMLSKATLQSLENPTMPVDAASSAPTITTE